MNCIAWPQLMRLGLTGLGLTPEVFWELTPAELMLMAGGSETPPIPTRKMFDELASRFPDAPMAAHDVEQY